MHLFSYMINLSPIGDFLLAEWLWGMTYGWTYFFMSIFCAIVLLRKMLYISWIKATLLAVSTHFFSFGMFTFVAMGIFANFLSPWYAPQEHGQIAGPFMATVYLGFLYCAFHGLFFVFLEKFFGISARRAYSAVSIGSAIAVVLSYIYLVNIMKLIL